MRPEPEGRSVGRPTTSTRRAATCGHGCGRGAEVPRLRLGVVVLLPADVAAEVDVLRRAVGDPQLGRVPAHLTLVPPVNVREDALSGGLSAMRPAVEPGRAVPLSLGPAATFLPATPVLYLSVGGDVVDAVHDLRRHVFRP